MRHRKGRRLAVRWVAAPVLAVATIVIPATAGQATDPPPSLRLFAGMHHVQVLRFADQPGLFVPGAVYVAATNGSFEVDPHVRSDGTIVLWQVRRQGGKATTVRRILPSTTVHIDRGLPRFFVLTMRNGNGDVVAEAHQPFCPTADFGAARINTSGPPMPTYPYFCGSDQTRATVWGINQGWAEPVYSTLQAPSAKVPDGDYTLTVRIAPYYVRQLHIPAGSAHTTLTVTVTTQTNHCPPKIVCGSAAAHRAMQAATRANPPGSSPSMQPGLPDLAALPAHGLTIEHNADTGHDYLDFAATIWNAGPGQLDVEGFRATDRPRMTARQLVYITGRPTMSKVIGSFEFDTRPGHNHWHLSDFAQYDLLNADLSREVLSQKQSFCLAPTDPIDLTRPGALWQPDKVGLFSSCPSDQSIWLRETLPPGWGDTYVQAVAGQSFDIVGLTNGIYFVRVTTNPFHRILEQTRTNNVSLVKIRLGGNPGARTVENLGAVQP